MMHRTALSPSSHSPSRHVASRLLCLFFLLSTLLVIQVHSSPVRRDAGPFEALKAARAPLASLDKEAVYRRRIWEEAAAFTRDWNELERRDVIVPKITSPDASSVWPVGSTQVVTWDTSNFPPDEQISNPIGKVILGRDTGDSLNLDFAHPLAQGFKLRDGKVSVVVPDVPPRTDYLIVLMGDSGNTSPAFAITHITGDGSGGGSSSSISAPAQPATTSPSSPSLPTPVTSVVAAPGFVSSLPGPLSSTTITDPIPITGSTITGGVSTDTSFPSSDSFLPTRTSTGVSASQTASGALRMGMSVAGKGALAALMLAVWAALSL